MTTDVTRAAPGLPSDQRLGQATAVEQSRAVAEVQATVIVARQCPRDIAAAMAAMRDSCKQPRLAERAFFRFPRGGQTVVGESVYLAKELARCWGNIQYGVEELSRDDEHGQSEMRAWAWDVETNARNATVFIVPHKRDKRGGPERLTDMRDIYENNANAGARRVRECIFSVLPTWYTEEAKELCQQTIEHGGGKPLARRIADALEGFDALGVSADQVERRIGRPSSKWTAADVAQLGITYQSIRRGELDRDAEFPPVRVTAAEILTPTTEAPAAPAVLEDDRAADLAEIEAENAAEPGGVDENLFGGEGS